MKSYYSFDKLNPEKYEHIRLSHSGNCSGCEGCYTVTFPFDQKPSSLLSDNDNNNNNALLWDEFGKEIDELLPQLNRHSLKVGVGTPLLMVVAAFGAFFLTHTLTKKIPALVAFFVAFVGVLFLGMLAQRKIYRRNQQVDQTIREICAKYKDRFQSSSSGTTNNKIISIIPEYRTKWTTKQEWKDERSNNFGGGEAAYPIPRRMIVFIPASSASAGITDDNKESV